MRIILLTLSLLSLAISIKAQDTLQKAKQIQAKQIRYPAFRHFTIQKDYFGDSDYKTYAKNGSLQDRGQLSTERLKIAAMIPLYSKKKLSMIANLGYTRENLTYFNETGSSTYYKSKLNTNDFDAALSLIHNGVLFKKPVISRATVVLGSSNFVGIKKVTASLSSAMVLKANATTVTTIGAVISFDKSALTPFIPLFSYWHKFSNSHWEMDLLLPQKVVMRRSGVLNGWVSTGVELNNSSFFIRQNGQAEYRSGNYEWSSTEIYTNIGYEHLVGKKLMLGVKGGYMNSLTTRLLKVNERIDHYKSRTRIAAPFFNMNLSFALK